MGGTRRRGAAVVVGALLVAALAPTVVAAVDLGVTVNATGVEDGGSVTVTGDPRLGIDASANASIQSVTVQVDGETRHSFEPGSETFSESVELDLDDGTHEVTVTVEAAERRQVTVTIKKDSTGPLITYTSPFGSEGEPGSVTINHANTTLAGELRDISRVKRVQIRRNYEWTFAGSRSRDRTTYRIDSPGDDFSRPLLFGLGDNTLEVVAIDEHGQRRTHEMTVTVDDDRRPTIDIDRFERTSSGELVVEGTVRDNVKVNTLKYDVDSTGDNAAVLSQTTKEPTRERLEPDFRFTASVDDNTETVVLEATDVAGNIRTRRLPIDYREHLEPTITLDRDAVQVDGDRIRFSGSATDSRITKVVVESVGPNGDAVGSVTAYDGEVTDDVQFRGAVGAAPDRTTLVVRVTDVQGEEYRETLTVETGASESEVETAVETLETEEATTAPPTATATATVAPTATDIEPTETATPTQANVDDGGGSGSSGSSIPLPGPAFVVALGGLVVLAFGMRRVDVGSVGGALGRVIGGAWRGSAGVCRRCLGIGYVAGAWLLDTAPGVVSRLGSLVAGVAARSGDGADSRGHAPGDSGSDSPGGVPGPAASETGKVPAGTPDMVDRLTGKPLDEFGRADVQALVAGLDADDSETVATAAERLGDLARVQPNLVDGSGAKPRLRDLRVAEDQEVSTAATRAIQALDDADIY